MGLLDLDYGRNKANTSAVFVPRGMLPAGHVYTFRVTACPAGGWPRACRAASQRVAVAMTPLRAQIQGLGAVRKP